MVTFDNVKVTGLTSDDFKSELDYHKKNLSSGLNPEMDRTVITSDIVVLDGIIIKNRLWCIDGVPTDA